MSRVTGELPEFEVPSDFQMDQGGEEAAELQHQLAGRLRSLRLSLNGYKIYDNILWSTTRKDVDVFEGYLAAAKDEVREGRGAVVSIVKDIFKLRIKPLPIPKEYTMKMASILGTPSVFEDAAAQISGEANEAETTAAALAHQAAAFPADTQLAAKARQQQETAAALREASAVAEAAATDEANQLAAVLQAEADRCAALAEKRERAQAARAESIQRDLDALIAARAAAGRPASPNTASLIGAGFRTPPRTDRPWRQYGLRRTVPADTSADQRNAEAAAETSTGSRQRRRRPTDASEATSSKHHKR